MTSVSSFRLGTGSDQLVYADNVSATLHLHRLTNHKNCITFVVEKHTEYEHQTPERPKRDEKKRRRKRAALQY
jgi:hypothetical protein